MGMELRVSTVFHTEIHDTATRAVRLWEDPPETDMKIHVREIGIPRTNHPLNSGQRPHGDLK